MEDARLLLTQQARRFYDVTCAALTTGLLHSAEADSACGLKQ